MFVLAVPRLQLRNALLAFRKDLSLALCIFPIHLTHCTYCQFIWYAEDIQLYVAISKDNYGTPVAKLALCLSTLHTCFCNNGLTLNLDKSETIAFGTTQRSRSFPITSTVDVAGTIVQISNQVRIPGVTLDSRLSFDAHIYAL